MHIRFEQTTLIIESGAKKALLIGSGTLVIDESDDRAVPLPDLPDNCRFIYAPSGAQIAIVATNTDFSIRTTPDGPPLTFGTGDIPVLSL